MDPRLTFSPQTAKVKQSSLNIWNNLFVERYPFISLLPVRSWGGIPVLKKRCRLIVPNLYFRAGLVLSCPIINHNLLKFLFVSDAFRTPKNLLLLRLVSNNMSIYNWREVNFWYPLPHEICKNGCSSIFKRFTYLFGSDSIKNSIHHFYYTTLLQNPISCWVNILLMMDTNISHHMSSVASYF